MTRKLLDDCFLHDSERLTHAEAVAILRAHMSTVVAIMESPRCCVLWNVGSIRTSLVMGGNMWLQSTMR